MKIKCAGCGKVIETKTLRTWYCEDCADERNRKNSNKYAREKSQDK